MNMSNRIIRRTFFSISIVSALIFSGCEKEPNSPKSTYQDLNDTTETSIATETSITTKSALIETTLTIEESTTQTASPKPFNFEEAVISVNVPVYDIVSINQTVLEGDTIPYSRTYDNYVLDENGNIISKTEHNKRSDGYGFDVIMDYYYDENGILCVLDEERIPIDNNEEKTGKRSTYFENGLLYTTYDYEYDSLGMLQKIIKDNYVYTYSYDKNKINGMFLDKNNSKNGWAFIDLFYDNKNRINRIDENNSYFGTYTYSIDKITYELKHDLIGSYYLTTEKGTLNPSTEWETFDEYFGLPLPNSCSNLFEYSNKAETDNDVTYKYILPKSNTKYTEVLNSIYYILVTDDKKPLEIYSAYLNILSEYCGFELEESDDGFVVNVTQNGEMVAILDFGNDPIKGYYMTVTMQK